MKNTYFNLIEQTYYFPQEGFDLRDGFLSFHGISIKYLIEKYGTPFRLMYLPRISDQIKKSKNLFNRARKKNKYKGDYYYCYVTKCCHFAHVIKTAIKEGVHLETSSSFDIDLIWSLYEEGVLEKSTIIVHNGYKTENYLSKIIKLNKEGFKNSIVVLDSTKEIARVKAYARKLKNGLKIGIRMAIDEEPQSAYYTSRLGIRPSEIMDFYKKEIEGEKSLTLKMLHFFVDSGIKDSMYYWGEFQKAMKLFVQLKKESPSLRSINLGGGFPIRNNLGFEYDYEYMINEIVSNIAAVCREEGVEEPDIFTEFGKYTVGESGAIIFSVLEQKQQNDAELWYMIDNSLMNTIPDAWSLAEKYILLPINKWENEYTRINIGGISCDHSDYYNSEDMNQQLHLPVYSDKEPEPLYLGFFHTGAYQDAISGYGGIKHCLIPSPKHVIIDRDEKGNFVDRLYRKEQTVDEMLEILGYNTKPAQEQAQEQEQEDEAS
ncbi:MAG: arginine decarboxylase [Bacteroidia bacterium]|nr:arginine decarboxylase [Bacteroidia bacterium]